MFPITSLCFFVFYCAYVVKKQPRQSLLRQLNETVLLTNPNVFWHGFNNSTCN